MPGQRTEDEVDQNETEEGALSAFRRGDHQRRKYDLIPEIFDDGLCRPQRPARAHRVASVGCDAVFKMFRGGFPDVHFDIDDDARRGRQGRDPGDRQTARTTEPSWATPAVGQEGRTGARTGSSASPTARSSSTGVSPTSSALLSQIGAIPPRRASCRRRTPRISRVARTSRPGRSARPRAARASKASAPSGSTTTAFAKRRPRSGRDNVAADYVDHPPARPFHVRPAGPSSLIEDVRRRSGLAFPDLTSPVSTWSPRATASRPGPVWRGTHTWRSSGSRRPGRSFEDQGIDFFRL